LKINYLSKNKGKWDVCFLLAFKNTVDFEQFENILLLQANDGNNRLKLLQLYEF